MTQHNNISEDYPFKSHFVDVQDSRIHYIDEGQGDPIVFIHGIPTWSYLWRNIIPVVAKESRCLALDLIGCGKSDKPTIDYSISDHISYLEGFIQKLDLKNITLVMHAWGSVIGLDYAMRHQDNIKSLVMLESHLRIPTARDMLSLPVQELTALLEQDDGGFDAIMNSSCYLDKVLQNGVMRKLTQAEIEHYRMPFKAAGSNSPIWQYLQELPRGNTDNTNNTATARIEHYSKMLQASTLPKLLLYAMPGFITTMDSVMWAKDNIPNLSIVDIGEALHFAQETQPDVISHEIKNWIQNL